jgi:FKBP-type peptidyl-prolyl cis-trans isomerase
LYYRGRLPDGRFFDSSTEDGEPSTIQVGDMVDCFAEGVRRMKVGGRSRVICPPETAYGDTGAPPAVLPGATLVYEIQLVDVVKAPAGATPGG